MTATADNSAAISWPNPLIDLLEALARSWRGVLLVTILGAGATVTCLAFWPPFFKAVAVAVLMPREKPSLDMTVRTSMLLTADNSAERSTAGPMMLPPQPELYAELLRSDRVLDSIAADLDGTLLELEREPDRADRLRSMIKVTGTEDGLLTVEATADNPRVAAKLANMLVAAGQMTSRSIERAILVEQMQWLDSATRDARSQLVTAETELNEFFDEHRLLDPAQENAETLRQIRETQMLRDKLRRQLGQRRVSYVDDEVGVRELRRQLTLANDRLTELDRRRADASSGADFGTLFIEHTRLETRVEARRDLLRTLEAQESIYAVRSEQPGGSLVVIKSATPPQQPAGPRRRRVALIGFVTTALSAIAFALLRQQWYRARQDPALLGRLQTLRAVLRWGATTPTGQR